jgi:predicted ATPase
LLPFRLALAFASPDTFDRSKLIRRMWSVASEFFPEMPKPVGVDGLTLLFETRTGAVVAATDLSDGEQAVLIVLAELALRAPANGIVLIDEVEQHLHPRWQRAMLDALLALSPTSQFILTTQAPYVAASAPDDLIKIGDWTEFDATP